MIAFALITVFTLAGLRIGWLWLASAALSLEFLEEDDV